MPDGDRAWVGFRQHPSSGEEAGSVGIAFAMLSGAALVFFDLPGLWMYATMLRSRARCQGRAAGGSFDDPPTIPPLFTPGGLENEA